MMFDEGDFAKVDHLFDEYFSNGKTPGLIYGVTVGQEIIHVRALGVSVIGGSAPNSKTTFRVASLTKSFAGAAILLLRDWGQISLEIPLVSYLPELGDLQSQFPDSQRITVRMLLNMSAGFPTDNEWADRLEGISQDGFGEALKGGIRFDSPPGTRYEYSNLGYALLGRVIFRITGRSFHEFVTEELLSPLELNNSTFNYGSALDLAIGYVKREEWEVEIFTGPGAFSPIGGLITNLEDLALWCGYLSEAFDPDSLDHGPLSKATRREMQEIQRVIPRIREPNSELSFSGINGYGSGLRVEEDYDFGKIVGHSGGYPGYGSHMRWHAASQIGVIALANGRYASPVTACVPALKYLLSKIKRSVVQPSEECLTLQIKVNKLIQGWDDQLAEEIFGFNMDLDHPRPYRHKKISDAVEKIGGLPSSVTNLEVRSENASHLAWKLAGNGGRLLIEIWLTPDLSAKLQVWTVLPVDLLNS